MADFNISVQYTLQNEGSKYTNNPADSGGPTKYGITLQNLGRWNESKAIPIPTANDVMNLTITEAIQIYHAFFWNPLSLDQIVDQRVATAIFDMGVNMGPGKSAEIAQAVAGVKADGALGPHSVAAINAKPSRQFLADFIAQIQDHYVELVLAKPDKIVFLKGWLSRSQKLITLMV